VRRQYGLTARSKTLKVRALAEADILLNLAQKVKVLSSEGVHQLLIDFLPSLSLPSGLPVGKG